MEQGRRGTGLGIALIYVGMWLADKAQLGVKLAKRIMGTGCLLAALLLTQKGVCMIVREFVVALILVVGIVSAACAEPELKQVRVPHNGPCDGTIHTDVPVYTNTTGAPVTLVTNRILMSGHGWQWAYLSRAHDGFFLAWAHLNATVGPSAFETDRTPLVLQPGERIKLVHTCFPPHTYEIWAFIEYR